MPTNPQVRWRRLAVSARRPRSLFKREWAASNDAIVRAALNSPARAAGDRGRTPPERTRLGPGRHPPLTHSHEGLAAPRGVAVIVMQPTRRARWRLQAAGDRQVDLSQQHQKAREAQQANPREGVAGGKRSIWTAGLSRHHALKARSARETEGARRAPATGAVLLAQPLLLGPPSRDTSPAKWQRPARRARRLWRRNLVIGGPLETGGEGRRAMFGDALAVGVST